MAEGSAIDADMNGPASPPRANGEIVFAAPWERRVFGITVAASRSGAFDWEQFRNRLIRRLADDDTKPYWQHWAGALEDVLEHVAVLARGELDDRTDELLRRPAGFDHHTA